MATEEVGIRLSLRDRRDVARGLQQTRGDVRGIGDEAERTGRRTESAFAVLKRAGTMAGNVAKVGTGLLVAAGGAAVGYGVKMAAANEQAGISFSTMLGGAKEAEAFLADLAAFAAKTPFDLPGLRASASSLISAGIDAKKVIPIMTSLGDATSGMGTGAEGIARATVALQQMNAAQKISGEDLNQLRDAGIPVFDLLSAATGKSVAAVAELAQKGKLGRKELTQLMSALESGKGLERFSGLMNKQSASLTGQWSSFTDTVSMGLGKVLDPWMPTLKVALGALSAGAGPFFDGLVDDSDRLARHGMWAVNMVRRGFREAGPVVQQVRDYVGGLVTNMRSGEGVDMNGVRDLATSAGILVQNLPALTAQLPSINDGITVAGTVTGFLADHVDTLAYLMPALAAGFVIYKAAQMGANVAASADPFIKLAQIIATNKLTASNRALAASRGLETAGQAANTAATNVNTASRGRQFLGMVASRTAMIAGTAVTFAATAAQWAWNVALNANPLGLIVLAVVAVGAAIYGMVKGVQYAYKNWDWFRVAVDKTWQALKTAWEWVKKAGSAVGRFFGGGDDAPAPGTAAERLPGRARGGRVSPDQAYVVGEHRREVFQPSVPGVIIPRVPQPREDLDGSMADLLPRGERITVIELDRREIARAVSDDWADQTARK